MERAVAACMQAGPGGPVLVGFSGGLDSTVLLHALAAEAAQRRAGLRAIHVHHGLHAQADAWAEQCRQACRDWGIECRVVRVRVDLGSGLGPEGAARAARHAAFAEELRAGETLALAHHRGDQAETVLLRLLRAAGSDGLSAMRAVRDFGRGRLWRPLLDLPRGLLHGYALAHGLRWLEDPSNAEDGYDRNFLRAQVLPLLAQRWPQAEAALAHSAALLAEDAHLLGIEAARHLQTALTEDPRTLAVAPLLALEPAWRARVLRQWLAGLGLPPLPARAYGRVDAELLRSRHDAQPEYRWAGLRLQRWRGLLHVEEQPAAAVAADYRCEWDGRAPLRLPGGALALAGAAQVPADLLPLRVGPRLGGERIRLPGRSHSHALKDCLLQAGVPPWRRRHLPLLRASDDELLAAGDAVLSARWQHACSALDLRLHWQPAPARD
jgi:tRNA(Ile)-lysidine synthase